MCRSSLVARELRLRRLLRFCLMLVRFQSLFDVSLGNLSINDDRSLVWTICSKPMAKDVLFVTASLPAAMLA